MPMELAIVFGIVGFIAAVITIISAVYKAPSILKFSKKLFRRQVKAAGVTGGGQSPRPRLTEDSIPFATGQQIAIGDQNVQVAGDVGIIVQGDYAGPSAEGIHGTESEAKFSKLYELMPELLVEMKDDITDDETHLIKEFYILHGRGQSGPTDRERFVYYKDEHDNLLNKLDLLEENGFIDDLTVSNIPIYRMAEDFIQLLLKTDLRSK